MRDAYLMDAGSAQSCSPSLLSGSMGRRTYLPSSSLSCPLEVFGVPGVGTVVAGTVKKGVIHPNMSLLLGGCLEPAGGAGSEAWDTQGHVRLSQSHHRTLPTVRPKSEDHVIQSLESA